MLDRGLVRIARAASRLLPKPVADTGDRRRPRGSAVVHPPSDPVTITIVADPVEPSPSAVGPAPTVVRSPLRPVSPRFLPASPPIGRAAAAGVAISAPAIPGRPKPHAPARGRRTPAWVGARAHLLAGTLAGLLLVAGVAAFWLVELHSRISQAALVSDIQTRDHPQAVRCVALKSNGSVWACGVAFQAESVCYLANISVLGSWHTQVANHKCDRLPALGGIPPRPTATAVAIDLRRQTGATVAACAKSSGYHNRWLCVERGSSGPSCVYVRVVPWVPFATNAAGANLCRRNPHLRVAFLGG